MRHYQKFLQASVLPIFGHLAMVSRQKEWSCVTHIKQERVPRLPCCVLLMPMVLCLILQLFLSTLPRKHSQVKHSSSEYFFSPLLASSVSMYGRKQKPYSEIIVNLCI